MSRTRRVLCIGLDGATFDVLLPWMEDGTLPNLAALQKSGVWGNLASTVPPLTAPAWISFMTGQNPGHHGIFHFLDLSDDRSRARGERRLADLSAMRSPALWDTVAHEGGRVALINIPMTYPPRPVNGLVITGMMTPPSAPFTYPSGLAQELNGYRIDIDRFNGKRPFARDTEDGPGVDDIDGVIREYFDLMLERSEVAHRVLRQEPWDFFMVVYTGTDRLGHYAWPYHGDAPARGMSAQERERRQAVRHYYQALDEQIGKLIEAAGTDAVTVIMSDHGMGPAWNRRVHLNDWLYREGLLRVQTRAGRKASPDDWLMRLHIPRDRVARLARSLPMPKKAMKKAAGAGGAEIDLDRSEAYYVHIYNHIGGIRIVADQPERRRSIENRLLVELPEMRDPENGTRIFSRVTRRGDLYQGPFTTRMPDLITIADPRYAVNTRVSHRSSLVTPRHETEIPGAHRDNGVFMASGPGIRHLANEIPNLRIEDLAPTMLYLLDCPIPSTMNGQVIVNALEPRVLAEQAMRTVPGDGAGRWAGAGDQVEARPTDSADEKKLLDHLEALGYL